MQDNRVFPKVDHSANIAGIVLVEYKYFFVKDLPKISQGFGQIILNT